MRVEGGTVTVSRGFCGIKTTIPCQIQTYIPSVHMKNAYHIDTIQIGTRAYWLVANGNRPGISPQWCTSTTIFGRRNPKTFITSTLNKKEKRATSRAYPSVKVLHVIPFIFRKCHAGEKQQMTIYSSPSSRSIQRTEITTRQAAVTKKNVACVYTESVAPTARNGAGHTRTNKFKPHNNGKIRPRHRVMSIQYS